MYICALFCGLSAGSPSTGGQGGYTHWIERGLARKLLDFLFEFSMGQKSLQRNGRESQQPLRLHCHHGERGDPAPLLSSAEAHLPWCVHCWGPQYKTDMNIMKQSRKTPPRILKHLSYEEKLRELQLEQPGEQIAQAGLSNIYKYPMGWCREEGT